MSRIAPRVPIPPLGTQSTETVTWLERATAAARECISPSDIKTGEESRRLRRWEMSGIVASGLSTRFESPPTLLGMGGSCDTSYDAIKLESNPGMRLLLEPPLGRRVSSSAESERFHS